MEDEKTLVANMPSNEVTDADTIPDQTPVANIEEEEVDNG